MPAEPPLHPSPDDFRLAARAVADWIAAYHGRVESFPVLSRVAPGDILRSLPDDPPQAGLLADGLPGAADRLLADLDRLILPGITHWQSPNFFAFFPANASFPATLAEFLIAGLGVNGMLWATSPAATELEIRVLDWTARLLGLPDRFLHATGPGGGCIQGTASESSLVAMLAARARAVRAGARPEALVAYASTQAHSSILKAALIAGIAASPADAARFRSIDTDAACRMRPDALARALERDRAAGLVPFFVCATVGTTSSTAIDPVAAIAEAARPFGPWLHVDAAHAAAAAVCPEFRHILLGVEHADSLCFNPHKWLLTTFDCGCLWVADRLSLPRALSVSPEYLRNPASDAGAVIDFRDWQIPLGRRFRALKLWFVIRAYGRDGLREHIRRHVRLAQLFESLVRDDDRFELAAPRTLNLVCFRLRPADDDPASRANADARTRALLDRLNASGRLYLTHTALPAGDPPADPTPRPVLRFCVGSTPTEERHVRDAWSLIQHAASTL